MTSRSISSVVMPSAAVRTMTPCCAGFDSIEDAAQALALVVVQALRDAVGARVRDQHHGSAGQRHLLGEAGALGPDGVLRDLTQDRLSRLQDLLDARVRAVLDDVLLVVLQVASVQHGILRRTDVDERRLHAGQHVLHPPQVDVPVDLSGIVRRLRDVVLDERASFEHRDLRGARAARARTSGIARSGDPCAHDRAGGRGSPHRGRPGQHRRRRRSPAGQTPCPPCLGRDPRADDGAGPESLPAAGSAAGGRAGAGMLSPIWGLRGTSTRSATSGSRGRPSEMRSGSSG